MTAGTPPAPPPGSPQVPPPGWNPPAWTPPVPAQGPPPGWASAPPRRLADVPRPDPPRSGPGWAIALIAVLVAALAGLVAVLVPPLPGPTAPGRSAPQATPGPAPTGGSPTSRPSATMPTDPEVLLHRNPVYAIAVPARCPEQRPPSTRAAFRSQVRALVACANVAWKKALAKTPVAFAKPRVSFYGSSTPSPCGRLGDAFPAAYCSADRTLYFATAAYRQGRYYRLAVAQFVMHEYAHHVQELTGIFGSSRSVQEQAAVTSRRIELQAHCMAQYHLTHSGLDFGGQDRADAEYQFGYTNDAAGHGSVKAERYWGRRGLAAATIGACNTWKVKASKVR